MGFPCTNQAIQLYNVNITLPPLDFFGGGLFNSSPPLFLLILFDGYPPSKTTTSNKRICTRVQISQDSRVREIRYVLFEMFCPLVFLLCPGLRLIRIHSF